MLFNVSIRPIKPVNIPEEWVLGIIPAKDYGDALFEVMSYAMSLGVNQFEIVHFEEYVQSANEIAIEDILLN